MKLLLAYSLFASLAINILAKDNAAVTHNYSILFYSGRGDNKDVYILLY